MPTNLISWRNGPCVQSASLWLDAPPVGRGLRFVSSCLTAAGRRSDRVLASGFTGRYHFGPERPFLTAPAGEPIRLGAAEVRLLPGGEIHGAAQLHYQCDDGALLYTVARRLSGTSLAPSARLVPADVWVLRTTAPPGDGPSWEGWLDALSEQVKAGALSALRVADVWLAVELAAGLAARIDDPPWLDVPSRRLLRWSRAEGPVPDGGGGLQIKLGEAEPEEVILVTGDGEESQMVPNAPGLDEIREAAAVIEPGEILFTGPGATSWVGALTGAGLPARILGDGPRRLL